MAGSDRMARVWSPGTNVGATAIGALAQSEQVLAPSQSLQAAQDRDIRDWTVTRVVGNMQLAVGSGQLAQVYIGIRVANENEVVSNITPAGEQTADWMYWKGHHVDRQFGSTVQPDMIEIDNRSQRKSRGMESVLILYTFNTGPDTVYMWWSGRTLLLVP